MFNPPIQNPIIGIIGGRGALGRIFKKAFSAAGFEVLISGRKPDGKQVLSNRALAKKADVVIVSVFLKDTAKVLREVVPLLSKKQLLVDFTSLKSEPIKIMLQSKAAVIGLHPMFGKVTDLAGQNCFVCPVRGKRWWPWFQAVLQSFGLDLHETSPEKHDELAATHQAIPHLLSIAFAIFLARRQLKPGELFKISSTSTRLALMTAGRLLASDLEMYRDIQLLNPATKKAATEIRQIFDDLTKSVEKHDGVRLLEELRKAAIHFGPWKNFTLRETNRIFSPANPSQFSVNSKKSGQFKIQDPSLIKVKNSKFKIAILGPATQTELAASEFVKKFKLKHTPIFFSTIAKVFATVRDGKASLGFVPLENYAIGPVRDTVKQLFSAQGKLQLIAEITRPIRHALIGQTRLKTNEVTRIFAHPQARAQCQKFLQEKFPTVEIVETTHTGESVLRAASEPNTLAIGPAEVAKIYRIKVLQKNIEDDPNNRTRFIAIEKSNGKQGSVTSLTNKSKKNTVLAFFFEKNQAGQLATALQIFAENEVNLSRLESIPTEKKLGEFFFFTECNTNPKEKDFQKAITKLRKIAKVILLGSH